MQRNDPIHQESVPTVGGTFPATPGDCFGPARLSHTAMAFLHRFLERNQCRRSVYRARHLRVCIDGEERSRCDPGVSVYELFRVPLSASYMEIFGDDDDGNLLLAVFPLPEPEAVEDDRAQHMCVTLEGGQTVAIEIALGYGTGGEVCEYVIRMAYSESAEVNTWGMANPSVEAIPAVPRPETPTGLQVRWHNSSFRPNAVAMRLRC